MKSSQRIHLTDHSAFWDTLLAMMFLIALILVGISIPLLSTQAIAWVPLSIGGIGFFLLLYGSFIEPQRISLNTKSIHSILPPMRIVVLGDIHVGPYVHANFVERIVQKANALHPDIIVLPGDFIFNYESNINELSPLKGLRATHGVFAIMGNHDAGHFKEMGTRKFYTTVDRSAEVTAMLESCGMTVLRNASQKITIGSEHFYLAGVDDIWMPEASLEKTFHGIPSQSSVILLCHNPDVILDRASDRASLIISGHTHGGQFRLPFIGAIAPIPDTLGRKYDQGIFERNNGGLIAITHGLGESGARARLFCPPEIMVLNVK